VKRSETIDIRNSEVDTPLDEVPEERGVAVEDGQMGERLAIIIGRRQDLMKVISCLKAAKGVHQGCFDRSVLRSSAVTPSLQTTISLVSVEGV